MILWRPRGLSWTMWKRMDACPRQAGFAIREREGDPAAARATDLPNMHAVAGTVVQKLFELYFNQEVNLRPKGIEAETLAKCLRRVLVSKWFQDQKAETRYPDGKTETDLILLITEGVSKGRKALFEAGILDKQIRSEVKTSGAYGDARLFVMADFVRREGNKVWIYDGKINSQANADPRQLLYAAAATIESGREVQGGGFIYWRLGKFVPVDLSPEKVQGFLERDWAKVWPLWQKVIRTGIDFEDLPAKPSFDSCRWCDWAIPCGQAVFHKKRPVNLDLPEEIDWSDIE